MRPAPKRFPRPLVVAALALLLLVIAVTGIKFLPTGRARAATTLVNNFTKGERESL